MMHGDSSGGARGTDAATNPDFARDVAHALMSLPAARWLGLMIDRLAPGEADLALDFRAELSARGAFQGGVVGAFADFAAGAAAATLLAPGGFNVTADYTVKLLAPANGDKLIAHGAVLHAGRTLTTAVADIYTVRGAARSHCACALVTMRNFDNPRAGDERR